MPEIELLVRYSLSIFLFCSTLLFSQHHPNKIVDSLLISGIEKIIDQEYSTAKKTFIKLDQNFKQLPLGTIYLSATEISKSVDFEEKLNSSYVDSLLNVASLKTEKLLESNEDDLWHNYYNALIYGYKAYYSAITGSIVSAFADGVISLQYYQKCLELDQNFNEALIAIGTYKYWKSAQTKSLSWIPFIPDDREEGINLLEKSLKSFSYNKYLAAYSLVWVYIDNEQSDSAIVLSKKMLSEHQDSRFFRWGLARAYQDIDKRMAIETFQEILSSIEKLPNRNYYNDIVLKHKIAMLLDEIGNYNEALSICNEILDFKFKSVNIKERLSDRIERAENLKQELLEKVK